MDIETFTIAARFNGPPGSGNGGYVCGRIARHIRGASAVTLRAPPPLETPLRVTREGDRVALFDGETLLAWGETKLPITDRSRFDLSGPDGTISVTFMLLGEMPGDAEGLAERLIAAGCQKQLEVLSTAMLVDDGGPQPG